MADEKEDARMEVAFAGPGARVAPGNWRLAGGTAGRGSWGRTRGEAHRGEPVSTITAANLVLGQAKGKRVLRHGESVGAGNPGHLQWGFASLAGAAESHPGSNFHPVTP